MQVWCACVSACMCKWRLEVKVGCLPSSLSTLVLLVSRWTWSLLIWLDWLASSLYGSFFFIHSLPPEPEVQMWCTPLFLIFLWVLGIWIQYSCLHFTGVAILQPHKLFYEEKEHIEKQKWWVNIYKRNMYACQLPRSRNVTSIPKAA